MANPRSSQEITDKWGRRTASASAEYEHGVRNPREDWAEKTGKAEANYEKGVQAAIGRKSFGKGVRATGTSGWQAAAIAKGPARFASGVQAGLEAYKSGFEPYRQALENAVLPPRGPKGDPGNINRVAAVAKLLHDTKLKLQG